MKFFLIPVVIILSLYNAKAQYWQQAVDYEMFVALDPETANYSGTQKLVYTNSCCFDFLPPNTPVNIQPK